MTEPFSHHPLARFLMMAAAIAFLLWGVVQAQAVVVSMLVSLFLAILATPSVLWLERRRVPAVLAVSIVVAGMVLVLLAIGVVVGASINSFYGALPHYEARIHEEIAGFSAILASKNLAPPEDILLKYLNPAAVMNLTAGLFMRLGSTFSNIVLMVLTATFILLEAASFPAKLRAVLGDPLQAFPQFTRFVDDIKRYMILKTLVNLATATLITIWLSILHVDFPFLWGFLAFLLNYVPTLGSTIAAIPAVFLTLLQYGVWRAVLAAAGYVVINFGIAYGVEIRLMGQRLGLSTLVVFLSLIFWGSLLGPIGAVLCIPLTMTLKFAFESNENMRWVGVLLGPGEAKVPAGPRRERRAVPRGERKPAATEAPQPVCEEASK